MQKFNIYRKSKKFHWNNSLIILILLFCLCVIYVVKQNFYNQEKGLFEDVIMKLMLGLFIIGFILKTIGLTKPKVINDEFRGFLEFHKDYIIIDQEKFKIDEIKTIEISNDDYYGKKDGISGFDSSLSNGTDNQILLRFNSGQLKSYNFELYNENDMENIEEELFYYYSKGKIDFFELTKILKIKSKIEIEEFRNKISLLK